MLDRVRSAFVIGWSTAAIFHFPRQLHPHHWRRSSSAFWRRCSQAEVVFAMSVLHLLKSKIGSPSNQHQTHVYRFYRNMLLRYVQIPMLSIFGHPQLPLLASSRNSHLLQESKVKILNVGKFQPQRWGFNKSWPTAWKIFIEYPRNKKYITRKLARSN